ncbi:MAG TPA: FAD-binding protein, partial [Thermoproteales archaeon]|nr:FAD-binding protein [Thermoproteales archaeon]
MRKVDIIIVGGGIAGLTAALYTSRQNLKTIVITMDIGGQLLITSEIQNYPGFKSISGLELARKV